MSWWRHQMETFSALLVLCAGNSPVTGEYPPQRPVTRSFDLFFDMRLNKRLSNQSCGWWFETPSCSLWRHHNGVDPLRFPHWRWRPSCRRSPYMEAAHSNGSGRQWPRPSGAARARAWNPSSSWPLPGSWRRHVVSRGTLQPIEMMVIYAIF